MIVGTVGHVDHGKTTLVRTLTGVDTDRLAEEKARGISIELGFAYSRLGSDPSTTPIGFIDVPGHRDFVQTMIAGAAGIDLGLLVVAADDGPMPQTSEHLAILQWFGIPRLVVALTKVDAVDDRQVAAARDALTALLGSTPYRDAPIVPLSSVSGVGLDPLRAVLLAERDRSPGADPRASRRFRLAVDRAFVLRGIGLVVTGTCLAGRVAVDDAAMLLPSRRMARVRSIHAQDEPVQEARAGQRVALNLVGRDVERDAVTRGDWLVDAAIAIESDRIDVRLESADGLPFDGSTWRHVRIHAGAGSRNARVSLLRAIAADARAGFAQVVLDRPMHLVVGDRFVLRDASIADGASRTIAGGTVLDVEVPARGRRGDERLRFLEVAGRGDPRATLVDAIDTAAKGVDLARWNATHNTAFTTVHVDAHAVGTAEAAILFSRRRWDALLTAIVGALAAEHAATPDAVGPSRDRLRRMAAPTVDALVFGALVAASKALGLVAQTGAWLHLPDHRVELSPDDRARFDRARAILEAAPEPNNPPRVRDVARALNDDEAATRRMFVRFASRGELYRIAHDHYFLPATVRHLATIAAEVAEADRVARAAPFRDRIGVGRKVAIQILEFFDRIGYTRRIGDDHRIIQPALFDG